MHRAPARTDLRLTDLRTMGALLALLAAPGCVPEDEERFGGGGSRYTGDEGVTGDTGEVGEEQPYITGVAAGFEVYDDWVIEFRVDYDYSKSLEGGTVELNIAEEGAGSQRFNLGIGTNDAVIDSGQVLFALDDVSRSKTYVYDVRLASPEGTKSQIWDGTVEATSR